VGRVYVPADWLREVGLNAQTLAAAEQRAALASIARRLAALAVAYRASARIGARRLPFRCRWAVLAASRIYGGIADKVAQLGPRAWDQRVTTSRAEKLRHVAAAWGEARFGPASAEAVQARQGLWTRRQRMRA